MFESQGRFLDNQAAPQKKKVRLQKVSRRMTPSEGLHIPDSSAPVSSTVLFYSKLVFACSLFWNLAHGEVHLSKKKKTVSPVLTRCTFAGQRFKTVTCCTVSILMSHIVCQARPARNSNLLQTAKADLSQVYISEESLYYGWLLLETKKYLATSC